MDKIQELQEQLNKIQDELTYLRAEQQKPKTPKRWRAGEDDYYWYVDDTFNVVYIYERYCIQDDNRYKFGNYFKTKYDAEDFKDRLLVNQQLKDIAEDINTEEIDWNNGHQPKSYLCLDTSLNILGFATTYDEKITAICCVGTKKDDFRSVAVDRIGEDRLKNYLMKGI